MKLLQKKEEKAFLELFSKYEADLYRIAFLHVKNEADALDVMQEVAYRAFKNRKTLENPEYLKTWLTRITMNCAIDHIRKNSKVVRLEPEYLESSEMLSKSCETEILLKMSLEDLMNELEPLEKNVIVLKYYEECSFREIAELLELPLGTVKTILYRALDKLRKKAKEDAL